MSRARNSGSLRYHAVAAIGSNGIWWVSNFFVIDTMAQVIAAKDWKLGVLAGLFYITMTVASSVGMHHFLQTKVEKGKSKVGA